MGIHYGKADFITYGKPSLFLDFANKKSLTDRISGNNLITFTRTSTGTYVGADGLIKTAAANEPRFDHNPATGESLGLLIEEQRTNNVTNSNTFNSGYSLGYFLNINDGKSIITPNTIDSPLGSLTGSTFSVDPSSTSIFNTRMERLSGYFSNGTTKTLSIFAKAGNFGTFKLHPANSNFGVIYNLNNGTFSIESSATYVSSASMIPYGNGWYRCTATTSQDQTSDRNFLIFMLATSFSDYLYVAGCQLENGNFPTSYIPTTASTVTRTADSASITGTNFSSWYNSNNGTIILRLKSPPDTTRRTVIGLSGGITQQQSRLIGYENGYFQSINDGSGIGPSTLVSTNSFHNGGVRYDVSADSLSVISNGGSVSTTTIGGSFLSSVSDWQFFYRVDGGYSRYNGTISKLAYYPTLLTDAQLQSITK